MDAIDWCNALFTEKEDADEDYDADEVEASKRLGMKRLNVTCDVSQTGCRIEIRPSTDLRSTLTRSSHLVWPRWTLSA